MTEGADRDLTEDRADPQPHTGHPLSAIDNGFAEMCERLDAFIAGQQRIVDMLTTLIAQRDDR